MSRGFVTTTAYPCLYNKSNGEVSSLLYVDDILISGKNNQDVEGLIDLLKDMSFLCSSTKIRVRGSTAERTSDMSFLLKSTITTELLSQRLTEQLSGYYASQQKRSLADAADFKRLPVYHGVAAE